MKWNQNILLLQFWPSSILYCSQLNRWFMPSLFVLRGQLIPCPERERTYAYIYFVLSVFRPFLSDSKRIRGKKTQTPQRTETTSTIRTKYDMKLFWNIVFVYTWRLCGLSSNHEIRSLRSCFCFPPVFRIITPSTIPILIMECSR